MENLTEMTQIERKEFLLAMTVLTRKLLPEGHKDIPHLAASTLIITITMGGEDDSWIGKRHALVEDVIARWGEKVSQYYYEAGKNQFDREKDIAIEAVAREIINNWNKYTEKTQNLLIAIKKMNAGQSVLLGKFMKYIPTNPQEVESVIQ